MSKPQQHLPADPEAAVRELTNLSEKLAGLMQQETNDMTRQDATGFMATSSEKGVIAGRYEQAANEFRERIEEFRSVDRSLLDKLEEAQGHLGEIARENVALIERMTDGQKE